MAKQQGKSHIIFDVDSNSIGVVVFEKQFAKEGDREEAVYREVFSQRKIINNSEFIDFNSFSLKTKRVFDDLALLAYSHTRNISSLNQIYINLSAPWVTNQKRILHFEKKKPFIYTNAILDHLLEKQKEKTSHHTHDYHIYDELLMLDQQVLALYANGYPVNELTNKEIKDLDVHLMTSFISLEAKDLFTEIVERHFHRKPNFIANIFMEYISLKNLFPQEKNIISFDVSAEITEITLIEKGALSRLVSVPVGSRTLKKSLASELGLSFKKTSSLLELYHQDHLDPNYQKKIELALRKAFISWFKEIYTTLEFLGREHALPHSVSLVAEKNIQEWLKREFLRSDELNALIDFNKTIEILDPRTLFIEKMGSYAKQISDTSLLYAVNFLEKYKK